MGLLLSFLFLMNMVGALVLLPALAHFLESARLQFTPHFVESTSKMFAVAGHFGLYAAMAVLFAFNVILAAKTTNLYLIVVALAWVLALAVLQYIGDRFSGALEKLNPATPGRMSSTAFLDCLALLHMLAGLIALIGLTLFALHLEMYSLILAALGLFVLLQFVAALAINPETLYIEIVSETGAGEEAIGVLSFVIKIGLRLVPVAFGTGVVLGTVWMLFACGLAVMPPESAKAAAKAAQVAAAAEETAGGWVERVPVPGALTVPAEYGPAAGVAATATGLMASAAALPFVMYLVFLLCHLGIDIVRAVFSLPAKLDRLAEGPGAEKSGG